MQVAPSANVSCAHFGASVAEGVDDVESELLCDSELEEFELELDESDEVESDELEDSEELELDESEELDVVSSSIVSSYVAFSLPSFTEAVIVTVPALRGLTIPVTESTDAIAESLEDHTTLPTVAFSGSATTLS